MDWVLCICVIVCSLAYSYITIQRSLSKEQDELMSLSEKLKKLSTLSELYQSNNNDAVDVLVTATTHYIRWGSLSCPPSARLLYQGFAGKSPWNQGGGVNFLCLPKEPDFPANAQRDFQSHSPIYGTEYQHHGSPLVRPWKDNEDVPCSVCEVSGRTDTLMIPAKSSCPTNWHKEYRGVIMAQHHAQRSSEYICVDEAMDVLHGGSLDDHGALLHVVEAVCGSLKCPPYVNGYEIICVVCTA